VIDCHVCVRATGRTSAHLKSVFKMSTVCSKSNASSKTWTPLPDRFVDDHLAEIFPFFDQARLQLVDVTNLAADCGTHAPAASPNLVVDWVKVRTVGWPQSWSDEVWCFMNHELTDALSDVLCGLDACVCSAILETEIFCRQYLNINSVINNIFL